MKITKLKSLVLKTAHLTGNDADMLFRTAYDAAMFKIYRDLRLTKSLTLSVQKIRRLVHIPRIIHFGGEVKSLPTAGRAYSLALRGKGEMCIKDGASSERISFDTDYAIYKGFIKEGGEICFFGDYFFTVEDFSLYSELYGSNISDIPDGGSHRLIDFSEYKDFGIFLSLPKDGMHRPLSGAYYEDTRLYLPIDYEGDITVDYLKRAEPMPEDGEGECCITEIYEPLLLPLILSYILAEEDSDMAENYRKIYSDMLSNISPRHSGKYECVVTDGWA